MKSRRTCASIKDIKTVCQKCGVRAFASQRPDEDDRLICWSCGYAIGPLDYTKEWACGDPNAKPPSEVFDLIYEGSARLDLSFLTKQYPNTVLRSDWDSIHEYRTEVHIDGANFEDYFYTIIAAGLAESSFILQMNLIDPKSVHREDLKKACKRVEELNGTAT